MVKKILLSFIVITIISSSSFAQKTATSKLINLPDSTLKIQIVETSCGQCQFKMAAKGCDLAVRIAGVPYFVTGTSIDQHGDAHAKDGFCEKIRKAEVQGLVEGDKFKVTYFKLLPEVK